MTTARPTLFAAGVGLVVAALAGCAQPEAPPDRFYRIAVTAPASPAATPLLPGSLVVERPEADGLLAGRPIVFVGDAPTAMMMEYPYDFWDKAPALLVRDALVDCLERANVARRVYTEQLRIRPDYTLIGRLIRFERIESTPPRAVVELKLGLHDEAADDLLTWTRYRAEEAAADESMLASVAAFDSAMSQICRRLTGDIASAVPPASGTRSGGSPERRR